MNSGWAVVMTASVAAVAYAGTACPDPFKAVVNHGNCKNTQCYVPGNLGGTIIKKGYVPTQGSKSAGGCKSPGNSQNPCNVVVTSNQPWYYPVLSGNSYDCTNGQTLWDMCEIQVTLFEKKDGVSDLSKVCDYSCPVNP